MASLRRVKKDIDYLVSEVVYDCYLALYFHSERRDAIVAVMEEAVDARNEFYEMANHPAEKHNKSLVKTLCFPSQRTDGTYRRLVR